MMREPVEQRGRHLGIAKYAGPFSEAEVGCYDDARALVQFREQVEQQRTAGLCERQIAQLIKNDNVYVHEPGRKLPRLSSSFLGF